jgi:hypothetical protein
LEGEQRGSGCIESIRERGRGKREEGRGKRGEGRKGMEVNDHKPIKMSCGDQGAKQVASW